MNSRGNIDYEKAFQNARFTEHQFKDSRIFKAASEYILSQKETVNGNFQSKYNAIRLRKWVIKMFFGNKLVEEINRKCILLAIEKNEKKSGFHLRFMWDFLFYLKDVGLLSPEWNKFEQMRAPLCTGREHNFSKALLSVEDSSRYYLFALGKRTRLYYLDSGCPEIRNLMINYLNKWDYIPENRDNILSFLFESHGIYLQSIKDINYSAFCRQVEILVALSDCIKYMEQLVDFYRFIFSNYNSDLFSETCEFDPRILLRRDLGVELAQGYRIVTYNSLAVCPDGDLWIASFYLSSEQYTRHTTLTEKIDFSVVKSTRYRDYLKKYMWAFPTSWSTKSATKLPIITFLNYITDIKLGQILTTFSKPTILSDHQSSKRKKRWSIDHFYPNLFSKKALSRSRDSHLSVNAPIQGACMYRAIC